MYTSFRPIQQSLWKRTHPEFWRLNLALRILRGKNINRPNSFRRNKYCCCFFQTWQVCFFLNDVPTSSSLKFHFKRCLVSRKKKYPNVACRKKFFFLSNYHARAPIEITSCAAKMNDNKKTTVFTGQKKKTVFVEKALDELRSRNSANINWIFGGSAPIYLKITDAVIRWIDKCRCTSWIGVRWNITSILFCARKFLAASHVNFRWRISNSTVANFFGGPNVREAYKLPENKFEFAGCMWSK